MKRNNDVRTAIVAVLASLILCSPAAWADDDGFFQQQQAEQLRRQQEEQARWLADQQRQAQEQVCQAIEFQRQQQLADQQRQEELQRQQIEQQQLLAEQVRQQQAAAMQCQQDVRRQQDEVRRQQEGWQRNFFEAQRRQAAQPQQPFCPAQARPPVHPFVTLPRGPQPFVEHCRPPMQPLTPPDTNVCANALARCATEPQAVAGSNDNGPTCEVKDIPVAAKASGHPFLLGIGVGALLLTMPLLLALRYVRPAAKKCDRHLEELPPDRVFSAKGEPASTLPAVANFKCSCNKCGKKVKVLGGKVGKRFQCPKCGTIQNIGS